MVGPKPTVSDEEILRRVALLPDPVVTAGEVADGLELTKQAVNKRLATLVEDNYLAAKKVGSAAKVYWITPEGRNYIAD